MSESDTEASSGSGMKVIIIVAAAILLIGGSIGGFLLLMLMAIMPGSSESDSANAGGGVHCAPEDSDDDDDGDDEDSDAEASGSLNIERTVDVSTTRGTGPDDDHPSQQNDGDSGAPETQVPEEYQDDVASAASTAGVPEELLAAQIYYESNWQEDAVSHVGARGLAQFMPATWRDEWGDIDDPHDSIAAQGEYMAEIRAEMEPHSDDEEHLWQLMLAAYNAGSGAVAHYDYDLDEMFSQGDPSNPNSYAGQTAPYVENIVAAAEGKSGANCSVPQGDLAETAISLAWTERVETDQALMDAQSRSGAPRHGEDEAKDEFVSAAEEHHNEINYAFFTDCGVFCSTAVRASGTDPNFQLRGTGAILDYVESSEEWDTFTVENEGELEPGDVLVYSSGSGGHCYIWTGHRSDAPADVNMAVGASLGTRPPSGHETSLSAPAERGSVPFTVARHTGSSSESEDDE